MCTSHRLAHTDEVQRRDGYTKHDAPARQRHTCVWSIAVAKVYGILQCASVLQAHSYTTERPDNEIPVFRPSPLRKFMAFCNVPRCYKRTLIHNGTARQRRSCFSSIAVTKVYGILTDAPPWPLHARHEHGMLQMRVLRRVPHPLHVLHVCMRSPCLEILGTRQGPFLMGHPAMCALRLW